jgi:hypothetical protein
MRSILLFGFCVSGGFLTELFAQAQVPRFEVFGGYSYSRLEGRNLQGWNASVATSLNDWLGIVADVSGHYGSDLQGFPFQGVYADDADLFSYRFGLRFTNRTSRRVTPFAQALAGRTHVAAEGRRVGGTGVGTVGGVRDSGDGLTVSAGGGFDVQATSRLALRIIQAEYNFQRFHRYRQNFEGARLSFGLVFRFGSEPELFSFSQ